MGYYSDPTASQAIGNVNREFSRWKKKAKRLWALYEAGELTDSQMEKECAKFKGVFRNVLYAAHPSNQKKK